jgi:hypothetical protein
MRGGHIGGGAFRGFHNAGGMRGMRSMSAAATGGIRPNTRMYGQYAQQIAQQQAYISNLRNQLASQQGWNANNFEKRQELQGAEMLLSQLIQTAMMAMRRRPGQMAQAPQSQQAPPTDVG